MAEPTVSINSVEYPCSKWEQIEQGRFLRQEWSAGFFGGMGEPILASRDRYYFADEWDATYPPYIRLRPAWEASITAANLDASLPCYAVYGNSPDGSTFMTVLNGQRSFKVRLSDNTLENTLAHAANTDLGRPALFEGTWRIPLGDTNAQADLTINNTGADTYTAVGTERAGHFAVAQDEATARLARITNSASGSSNPLYLLDFSPSGASGSFGGDSEVGDSSLPVADLVVSAGELVAFKPDGPYRFDAKGQSLPVQEFVGRNPNASITDGSNSHGHGPYWYWVHSSTLWRGIGDQILPISPADDPRYINNLVLPSDFPPFIDGTWSSFTAWGRWAYATHDTDLFIGFIRNDGTVLWHGKLYSSSAVIRCFITAGPTLWVLDNIGPTIRRLNLQSDGSIRAAFGDARGETNLTGGFYLPEFDFGLPDRQKQMRRLWAYCEGTLTNAGLGLFVSRDGGSMVQIGSDITTTGLIERAWTAGSSDLIYRLFMRPRFSTNGSYTTTDDPRIRQIGAEARTADIWRYTIPLTADRKDKRDLLRNAKNGQRLAIIDPDENTAYNGYVLAVRERAQGDPKSADFRYVLEVDVERWDA